MSAQDFKDFITFKKIKKSRRRQAIGFAMGIAWCAVVLYIINQPQNKQWTAHGPMNTGHEKLDCQSCHKPAEGGMRQQLQAQVKFKLGLRKTEADFGLTRVDNTACQNCHARPNDQHPVHRFKEPRFTSVRQAIDVTQCQSCHNEHRGARVTLAVADYCQNCHQDLNLKDDPLDLPHKDLVKKALWTSCMKCHDFHGNHERQMAEKMQDTIRIKAILDYFQGGADPYSKSKFYQAKRNSDEK